MIKQLIEMSKYTKFSPMEEQEDQKQKQEVEKLAQQLSQASIKEISRRCFGSEKLSVGAESALDQAQIQLKARVSSMFTLTCCNAKRMRQKTKHNEEPHWYHLQDELKEMLGSMSRFCDPVLAKINYINSTLKDQTYLENLPVFSDTNFKWAKRQLGKQRQKPLLNLLKENRNTYSHQLDQLGQSIRKFQKIMKEIENMREVKQTTQTLDINEYETKLRQIQPEFEKIKAELGKFSPEAKSLTINLDKILQDTAVQDLKKNHPNEYQQFKALVELEKNTMRTLAREITKMLNAGENLDSHMQQVIQHRHVKNAEFKHKFPPNGTHEQPSCYEILELGDEAKKGTEFFGAKDSSGQRNSSLTISETYSNLLNDLLAKHM